MQITHSFSSAGESWTLTDHSPKEVVFDTQAQLLEALERRQQSISEVIAVTRLQVSKKAPKPKPTVEETTKQNPF